MKKVLWSISLLICLVISGCTEEAEPNVEEQDHEQVETEEVVSEVDEKQPDNKKQKEPQDTERPEGFLWEVSNGPTKVYMLGTIHVAPEDFFPMAKPVEEAYEQADVIVPEIDMNNINMIEMTKVTTELARYQNGSSLQDHVSSDVFQQIENKFKGTFYSADMLNQFKPWFVMTLIEQMRVQNIGYTDGVDQYFLDKAEKDQKEIIALETVEDQLSIFAGISPDYQVEMLKDTLAVSQEQYKKELDQMLELYRQGDKKGLLDLLMVEGEESNPDAEAYMTALNDNRNYNMAEQIQGFLESGEDQTYFVIVGALHLTLEPHIRSILEKQGFSVERVQE